ncbi:homeobox domain-containing protein, partial [Spinellus fusiger]
RKRTRASAEQLAVLEDTFAVNVSPNSKLRKQLADQLQMSERSIQIWFQNRRAKVKHMQKRAQIQMQQASIRAQLYHYNQQQHGMHPYGENKAYLNATTLIIGTWHRLRLRTSDLLCVYEPDQRQFAWYITDSNCHFKMVVALKSVANIEYVPLDDQQADVHFDMNEPPLFYMESTHPDTSSTWIQCSDFTEEKQASRFFRHTLKGMVHTL